MFKKIFHKNHLMKKFIFFEQFKLIFIHKVIKQNINHEKTFTALRFF